ncbi:HK97 family phage prohead protease [Saccharopolyspora sp. NPDC000359]|uniref:HK97 family phage prohead protease n=1 Tax=Saccharopolyspora sp. NPDC000359 TaxID=3154251 RepID=UPI003320F98D
MPQTKDFGARVKAAGDADGLAEGEFTALVSVFGNVDSVGDVVVPGAFADSLAEWAAKGDPLPVIWAHDWSDPYSHIGHVTQAEETADGLVVTGQLDLDNPKALQVYRLLKGRRVTQFSFAYDIEDAAPAERDGREVYELRKLRVHEVGPCLIGANQETQLLAAKARRLAEGAKAGRVLSAKNYEALRAAYEQIGEVLAAAEPTDEKTAAPTGADIPDQDTGQPEPAAASDPNGAPAKSASPRPAQVAAWSQLHELLTGVPDADAA